MTTTSHAAHADPHRINPTTWNHAFRYDQAQLRPAPTQVLSIAGQGALTGDGDVVADGDMAGQLAQALTNVEELLAAAGMDLRDVLTMTVYVTDMDLALAAYSAITRRLDAVGATPPATLVGVHRLAIPTMLAEITAQAGR